MKKILVLAIIGMLVAMGSGLTVMQEAFWANGQTTFYEKDVAQDVGMEVLKVYNENGYTEIGKAIIADRPYWRPRMSVTEKVILIPATPPPSPDPPPLPDPYEFMGMAWGPNVSVFLNQDISFENTDHHTVLYNNAGDGAYAVETQGDSAIITLRNKKFSPWSIPFLDAPELVPIQWPGEPPDPIDP